MQIFWRRRISHGTCAHVFPCMAPPPRSSSGDSFQIVNTFKQGASRFHQAGGDDADNHTEVVAVWRLSRLQ